jgi:hypothetical protein
MNINNLVDILKVSSAQVKHSKTIEYISTNVFCIHGMNYYNYLVTNCKSLNLQSFLYDIKAMGEKTYDMNKFNSHLNVLSQDMTLCDFIIDYYEKVIR